MFLEFSLSRSEGERFLYFPSIFAVLFIVYAMFNTIKNKKITIFVFLVTILISSFILFKKNEKWAIAGRYAKSIADSIAEQSDTDSLILINSLDNYKSAFVYRNGLLPAIKQLQNKLI